MTNINIGSVWKHFIGGFYVVKEIAIDPDTKEFMVVYQSLHDCQIWVRKLSDFLGEIRIDRLDNVNKQNIRFVPAILPKII